MNFQLLTFHFQLDNKDHLGNNRLSYTLDPETQQIKILEENHYYPFGLKHGNYNAIRKDVKYKEQAASKKEVKQVVPDEVKFKYLYNAKELQDELGLNIYDYGARTYDPAAPRFWQIDPLAEKYSFQSVYVYADDNPVRFMDIDGKGTEDEWIVDGSGNKKWISNRGGDEVQYIHYTGEHPFSGKTMIALGNFDKGVKYFEMLKTSDVKINPEGKGFDYSDVNYIKNRNINTYYNDRGNYTFNQHPITGKPIQNIQRLGIVKTNNFFFDVLAGKEVLKGFQLSESFFKLHPRLMNQDVAHRATTFFRQEIISNGKFGIKNYKTIYFNHRIGNRNFSIGINPWKRTIFHEGPGIFK